MAAQSKDIFEPDGKNSIHGGIEPASGGERLPFLWRYPFRQNGPYVQ